MFARILYYYRSKFCPSTVQAADCPVLPAPGSISAAANAIRKSLDIFSELRFHLNRIAGLCR
jgi:hypothetical protein